MPNGGTLTVRLTENDRSIIAEVIDTGVGIPEAIMGKIFKPFFSQRADQMVGTGLGLTIVKSLVEKHRGTITVTSQVGSGTTFTLTFPRPDSCTTQ